MSQQSERAKRLRAGLENFAKVGAEVHSAFAATEDALTVLEDRETRRTQRNANNVRDPRQTVGGS